MTGFTVNPTGPVSSVPHHLLHCRPAPHLQASPLAQTQGAPSSLTLSVPVEAPQLAVAEPWVSVLEGGRRLAGMCPPRGHASCPAPLAGIPATAGGARHFGVHAAP